MESQCLMTHLTVKLFSAVIFFGTNKVLETSNTFLINGYSTVYFSITAQKLLFPHFNEKIEIAESQKFDRGSIPLVLIIPGI